MPGQFRVKKLWLAKCTCLNNIYFHVKKTRGVNLAGGGGARVGGARAVRLTHVPVNGPFTIGFPKEM